LVDVAVDGALNEEYKFDGGCGADEVANDFGCAVMGGSIGIVLLLLFAIVFVTWDDRPDSKESASLVIAHKSSAASMMPATINTARTMNIHFKILPMISSTLRNTFGGSVTVSVGPLYLLYLLPSIARYMS